MKVCVTGPFHTASILPFFSPSQQQRLETLPGMGGYPVTEMVLARREMGLKSTVITLDPCARTIERFEGEGIEYIVCPRRSHGLLRDAYAAERRYLREAIRLSAAEVVHAHWSYEYALGALDAAVPALITLRDHPVVMLKYLDARCIIAVLYALLVLKRGRCFTAVSPAVARFAQRVSGRNVAVMPNCYPLLTRELRKSGAVKKPFASGNLRLISLLNSSRFKNASGGLKAFSIIRRRVPHSEYLLVGPGLEQDGPVFGWAAQRGLDRGVRFMGRMSHREALEQLAQADILLHPSLQEACPNAVIEAMALGKSVVVSHNWADAEWLVGDAGLLVDGRKPAEIAEKICLAMGNLPETLKICAKAATDAEARFAPEKIVGLYEGQYETAIIAHGT